MFRHLNECASLFGAFVHVLPTLIASTLDREQCKTFFHSFSPNFARKLFGDISFASAGFSGPAISVNFRTASLAINSKPMTGLEVRCSSSYDTVGSPTLEVLYLSVSSARKLTITQLLMLNWSFWNRVMISATYRTPSGFTRQNVLNSIACK